MSSSLRKLICLGRRSRLREEEDGLRPKSLAPGSEEVLKKQVAWLEKEEKKLGKIHAYEVDDAQSKFKKIIHEFQIEDGADAMLTKAQLNQVFREMGVSFEPEVFDKVYAMFDADGDGSVNKTEFVVTFCFLMGKSTAHDAIELAYQLFDTNRDNHISKREFNDMIASLIPRLVNVLNLGEGRGRKAFEDYLDREFAGELLRFLDEVRFLERHSENAPSALPLEEAQLLFSKYLEIGSEEQINVSEKCREDIRKKLDRADNGREISISVFDPAAEEALVLIEEGPLVRFKTRIRTSYDIFANAAWEEFELNEEEGMSLDVFRKWAEQTPGLFNFFETLHDMLELSTELPGLFLASGGKTNKSNRRYAVKARR